MAFLWFSVLALVFFCVVIALLRGYTASHVVFSLYLLSGVVVPPGVVLEISASAPLFSIHRALLLLVYVVFAAGRMARRETFRTRTPMDIAALCYVIGVLPSIVLSADRLLSTKMALSEVMLQGLAVGCIAYHLAEGEANAKRLISWICAIGVLAALIGVAEVTITDFDYKEHAIFKQFNWVEEGRLRQFQEPLHQRSSLVGSTGPTRAESNFMHPIAFGAFLVLLFPVMWAKTTRQRTAIMQVAAVLGGLLAASVRGPWAVVVLTVLPTVRRRFMVAVLLVAFVGVVVVPHFRGIPFASGASLLDFNVTEQGRIRGIQENLAIFASKPLFGVGFGQVEYGEIYGVWDNYLTAQLRATGAVGVLGWLGFWLCYFVTTKPWRMARAWQSSGWIVVGCSVGIAGALLMSMAQNSAFQFKETNVFVMTLMGLSLRASQELQRGRWPGLVRGNQEQWRRPQKEEAQ